MEKELIEKEVKRLGQHLYRRGLTEKTGWFQEIELGAVKTNSNRLSNYWIWENIESLIHPLKGKRVLDIGCNAGLYSINAALEGASVVGVDSKQCWLDQAALVRKFYEELNGELPISYLLFNVAKEDIHTLGKFDHTICMGVAAELLLEDGFKKFSKENMAAQDKLLGTLPDITESLVIRSYERNFYMSPELYDRLMYSVGFRVGHRIVDHAGLIMTNYVRRKFLCRSVV